MANILVVDRDVNVARRRAAFLQQRGHDVVLAEGVAETMSSLDDRGADIVLVSQTVADSTGPQLCRDLRADDRYARVPVMIVGDREDVIDRVVAFEVGADDVVGQRCSLRELELRIRAVLRRGPTRSPTRALQKIGVLQVDPAAHEASVRGETLELSALEFRLLTYLMRRRGRVQRRERLLADVWNRSSGASGRTVDACVKRLRAKLGEAEHYIGTVRGVGYVFFGESR